MIRFTSSPHAVERAKLRTGWCRQVLERMLERIFYFGLSPENCGRPLREYLDAINVGDTARFSRIYGDHVFIFGRDITVDSADELALITILHVPNELRPMAHRARARTLQSAA